MSIAKKDEKPNSSTLPKSQTGITGLDKITGVGLPKGRSTLICGEAGCGKILFIIRGTTEFDESGRYTIAVVDLLVQPQLAEGDQVFAISTLVRKVPEPIRKIIGDLSAEEKLLASLNTRPR